MCSHIRKKLCYSCLKSLNLWTETERDDKLKEIRKIDEKDGNENSDESDSLPDSELYASSEDSAETDLSTEAKRKYPSLENIKVTRVGTRRHKNL